MNLSLSEKIKFYNDFTIIYMKFRDVLKQDSDLIKLFGVNYDTVNSLFKKFLNEYKKDGHNLSTRESFNNAYKLNIDTVTDLEKSDLIENLFEDILNFYLPDAAYEDIVKLVDVRSLLKYFDDLLKSENTAENGEDDASESESEDDDENDEIRVSIVPSEINLSMVIFDDEPQIIAKRTGCSRINIYALINTMFDLGYIGVSDANNLETMLYYYAIGFAKFDATSYDIYITDFDADFMKSKHSPGFVSPDKLIEKEHGKELWGLFKGYYYAKTKTSNEKIKFMNYLVKSLIQSVYELEINFVHHNIRLKFPGKLTKRENHFVRIPKIIKYFDGTLINSGVVYDMKRKKDMICGILLKCCDSINLVNIDNFDYINYYLGMPLNFVGKVSRMNIELDTTLVLLYSLFLKL